MFPYDTRCQVCYERIDRDARTDAKYCSDACRQAMYRRRLRERDRLAARRLQTPARLSGPQKIKLKDPFKDYL